MLEGVITPPEAAPPLSDRALVSVVIPVRNEEAFVGDVLAQLLAQDYPVECLEILVCDGRSTDRTRDVVSGVASRDERVILLDNPRRRSSSARNVGIRASRGEIVLVIDGHVQIPDTRLLRRIVDTFRETGADCLGRPQPLIPQGNPWSVAISRARASLLGHGPSSLIYSDYEGFAPAASMGAAYRRHVFDQIGMIDESFDACEDLEFNTRLDRAGLRCFTSPSLTVRYYARDSLTGLFRQLFRYGAGRWRYVSRFPSAFGPGLLCPLAVLGALLILPFSRILPAALAWCVWAGLSSYALAVVAWSVSLSVRGTWSAFSRYLIIFPTIHAAAALGFLAGLLHLLPDHSSPEPTD